VIKENWKSPSSYSRLRRLTASHLLGHPRQVFGIARARQLGRASSGLMLATTFPLVVLTISSHGEIAQ
jgi:hypothetical protein